MLADLFPRVHRRYAALRLLGPSLEGFAQWLFDHGYHRALVRRHLRTARRIDRALRQRACRSLTDITREALHACAPRDSQDDTDLASTLRTLERYLDEQGVLPAPGPLSRQAALGADYGVYLADVRGLVRSTIADHVATASQFLDHLGYEARPACLAHLGRTDLEAFVRVTGARLSRASLQHVIAHLRSFLRFLAGRGEVPPGLASEIDTPRVYRGERLPRALPWETVRAFLRAIDRTTPLGRRDYAIFLLIATYGWRSCEIVTLTLDDIEWRAGRLRVPPRKTAAPRGLPLTDAVGAALVDYLRHGRPPLPHREVFLRGRAPAGLLKPTAVTEAFQAWARRSGLPIPFQGPHGLRHAYAVHLLRQGTPLKTIGDVLGHRSAESTCVYLRLAVEDLRDVALGLPAERAGDGGPEGRP
jgi:site-specific recombinase XerD